MMRDIQFYFLYARRHALDYHFPKHVYSVVRSPSQCKELLVNFRSYYNCRRFGVLFNPRSQDQTKVTLVNLVVCFSFFFRARSIIVVFVSSDVKIARFFIVFTTSAVNSRTSLILINGIESC